MLDLKKEVRRFKDLISSIGYLSYFEPRGPFIGMIDNSVILNYNGSFMKRFMFDRDSETSQTRTWFSDCTRSSIAITSTDRNHNEGIDWYKSHGYCSVRILEEHHHRDQNCRVLIDAHTGHLVIE